MLGGGRNTIARELFNDVWASADYGVTWEQVRITLAQCVTDNRAYAYPGVCWQRTASAEWSPRAGMETAVLESSVVLMGGDHDVPVFSSAGETICPPYCVRNVQN